MLGAHLVETPASDDLVPGPGLASAGIDPVTTIAGQKAADYTDTGEDQSKQRTEGQLDI
ncbi:hypothetical protein ACFFSW_17470 [Saccharothrix longispora]|uniref:Succinyl-CoA synthetase beta subunit n=1 Tax=Saccharothrix longispora TaxID=33920 RepID=A0ABU1PPM9_9PSEU|nr:hypothetical protein [Saccharothrix longispora]MDR6592590.1 succinyl-CoA synthetase beta subunit [Saccharothrix longispora]